MPSTRAQPGGVPIYFHPPCVVVGITRESKINPGRRDACQLHAAHVSLARFLAATTPVATRRRRRRRPFDACCSPGSGGRRGAASDAADGRQATTGRPCVATPRRYPGSSERKARALPARVCVPGTVVRQTTSSVWRAAPSDVVGSTASLPDAGTTPRARVMLPG